MAGVAAAVDAVVSRRDAASLRGLLKAARGFVSELSAAEDRDEQRLHMSPEYSEVAHLVRMLDDLTRAIDPRGRSAPGYCARALRELCYDAEDSLDALVALRPPPRGMFSSFRGAGNRWAVKKVTLRVAFKLGAIRASARAASKRLREGQTEEEEGSRRPPPAAPGLVGLDVQRDRLAEMLLSREAEEKELKAVAIVGDDGAGKTTLAHEVFRTIGASFDCLAWISASRKDSSQAILNDIARQVNPPRAGDGADDQWLTIEKFLQHKRYLIVLEDITFHKWQLVRNGLPSNRPGSRVIMTTRTERIDDTYWSDWDHPNSRVYFHYIPRLTPECSRILFHRRIFGSEDGCPPELVDVAGKILEKCGGAPLAVTVMSGLLANKPCSRSIWEGVDRSIGYSSSGGTETTKNICLLGYYALPHHLRTCLLHLSVFPENHPFTRDRAVRSWMAEGFVSEEHCVTTLKEAGESYFDDLVSRSVVQPVYGSYRHDGKPEAYTIHIMMRYPIRRELARDNFVTLLDNGESNGCKLLRSKVRRLSVNNARKDRGVPESMDIYRVRSLYIFGGVMPKLSFKHLTFLRVLDLEGCKDLKNSDVVEIVELVHLRYLSIRDTSVTELPDQIGQLQNLTMLDVRGTSVRELPASVSRLQRLAHLLGDQMRLQEWIGKIAALSCLSQFDIFRSETVAMEELGNLPELRELGIWWCPCAESSNITERYEHFAISLYRLKKLQSLRVHGSDSSPVDLLDHLHHPLRQLQKFQLSGGCYVHRIPEWFRSLPTLAYLRIDVKDVRNEDLQLLSELPSLRHLSLSCRDIPTEQLVCKGFPVLRELQLCSVRADLAFEPRAVQKLESLLLSLHVVPEETYGGFSISIGQFACLEKIEIRIHGESEDASAELFKAANVAIRNAAEEYPNRPAVSIITDCKRIDCAPDGKRE